MAVALRAVVALTAPATDGRSSRLLGYERAANYLAFAQSIPRTTYAELALDTFAGAAVASGL